MDRGAPLYGSRSPRRQRKTANTTETSGNDVTIEAIGLAGFLVEVDRGRCGEPVDQFHPFIDELHRRRQAAGVQRACPSPCGSRTGKERMRALRPPRGVPAPEQIIE